jgi:hypothetical protein
MPYDPEILAKHKLLMSRGAELSVVLVTHYGQRSHGLLRVVQLSAHEANAPARRWLFLCLALAPVSFAFPPHVPWPLLTIGIGIAGYYLRQGTREQILGGEAECPKCGAFQILDGGNAEFPMAHFCSACSERSLLEPSEAPPPEA